MASRSLPLVVKGMHRNFDEWVQRQRSRNVDLKGLIHSIEEKHFTTRNPRDDNRQPLIDDDGNMILSDRAYFNTDWEAVPCVAGDVRITRPELPHGAQRTFDGIPTERQCCHGLLRSPMMMRHWR